MQPILPLRRLGRRSYLPQRKKEFWLEDLGPSSELQSPISLTTLFEGTEKS